VHRSQIKIEQHTQSSFRLLPHKLISENNKDFNIISNDIRSNAAPNLAESSHFAELHIWAVRITITLHIYLYTYILYMYKEHQNKEQ